MKVMILADGFVTWGGGVDFLRLLIRALKSSDKPCSIIVLARDDQSFARFSSIKRLLSKVKKALRLMVGHSSGPAPTITKLTPNALQEFFEDLVIPENIKIYRGDDRSLATTIDQIAPDVVLPSIRALSKLRVPWIGYIFDFQHRYFPTFFRPRERRRRNASFRAVLYKAKHVLVNAKAVKIDCAKFYPSARANVHALPFTPARFTRIVANYEGVQNKYNIPARFFLISNQFWVHKDHRTAIEAFIQFAKTNSDTALVCTGNTHDSRAPNLFRDLQRLVTTADLDDRIIFLGHIPKADQQSLMSSCMAVIQPTLFEGGPGGGQVFEALAWRVPCMVSDIMVNREINSPLVKYFTPGDCNQLAQLMTDAVGHPRVRPSEDDIETNEDQVLKSLGNFLITVISEASSYPAANTLD